VGDNIKKKKLLQNHCVCLPD